MDGRDRPGYDAREEAGKLRKRLRHRAIDLAAGRHHEIGDALEPLPAPGVEFRWLAVARRQRIDLALRARETPRKPFLALAAEFGEAMRWRPVIRRELVGHPIDLGQIVGGHRAGFLP